MNLSKAIKFIQNKLPDGYFCEISILKDPSFNIKILTFVNNKKVISSLQVNLRQLVYSNENVYLDMVIRTCLKKIKRLKEGE